MAFLEASVWLAVLLPVLLLGVLLTQVSYDQSVLKGVPQELIREGGRSRLRWKHASQEGKDGQFQIDEQTLTRENVVLAEKAVRRVEKAAWNMEQVSAKACFWLFSVDPMNGRVKNRLRERCEGAGADPQSLTLNEELLPAVLEPVGMRLLGEEPLSAGGVGARYVDVVVLVGLKITGEVNTFGLPLSGATITFGQVSVPRMEVGL